MRTYSIENSGFSTIQKLSYYKLANAITSAFKRCKGDKKTISIKLLYCSLKF